MKRVLLPTLLAFAAGCDRPEQPPRAFFSAAVDGVEVSYNDCGKAPFEAVQSNSCISILLRCGKSEPGVVNNGASRVNVEFAGTANGTYALGHDARLELSASDGRVYATDDLHTGTITIRSGYYDEPVDGKYEEYLEGEFSAEVVEQNSQSQIPAVKQITGGRFHLRKRKM